MLSLLFIFGSITKAFHRLLGKVYDVETNDVLPGVTIIVEGTQDGTVSGFDGTFSLDVSPGTTLVVSYIGYTTAVVESSVDTNVGLTLI